MPRLCLGLVASWPGRLERRRNGAELRAEGERHPATIASRRDGGDAADRAGVHWLGSCASSLTSKRAEWNGRRRRIPWCPSQTAPSSARSRWLDAISTCPWPWRASSRGPSPSATKRWPTWSRWATRSAIGNPAIARHSHHGRPVGRSPAGVARADDQARRRTLGGVEVVATQPPAVESPSSSRALSVVSRRRAVASRPSRSSSATGSSTPSLNG